MLTDGLCRISYSVVRARGRVVGGWSDLESFDVIFSGLFGAALLEEVDGILMFVF